MNEICVKKKLFGGEITFIIYNTEENIAKELVEEAYEEGMRLEKIFNFFDKKSSLSLLNNKRKMEMPEEFIEVLKMALKMCKETNGLYDVSLGKEFLERKSGKEMSKVNCSYKDIEINEGLVELRNKDVLLDLGSIAKGYITDKMIEVLKSSGIISGLIDSRGDIGIFGEDEREISIQHPREKEKVIGKVKIKEGSIATSGDYNQYNKSFDESHIINKRDYISTTVIASTLTEADLYATSLMVLPKEKIKKLLDKNKKISALCISKDLKTEIYNNFPRILI
jgi:thiamine biosynthesis lipoprotein ApbE